MLIFVAAGDVCVWAQLRSVNGQKFCAQKTETLELKNAKKSTWTYVERETYAVVFWQESQLFFSVLAFAYAACFYRP